MSQQLKDLNTAIAAYEKTSGGKSTETEIAIWTGRNHLYNAAVAVGVSPFHEEVEAVVNEALTKLVKLADYAMDIAADMEVDRRRGK